MLLDLRSLDTGWQGTVSQHLGGLLQVATGAEVFSGTIAERLGGLQQSASGAEVFSGSATQRLAGLRQSATGAEVFSGTASQRLGGLGQVAIGVAIMAGSISQRLGGLRQTATGAEVFSANGSQRIGALRQAATGSEVFTGAAAQRLGGLVQAASSLQAGGTFTGAQGGGVPQPLSTREIGWREKRRARFLQWLREQAIPKAGALPRHAKVADAASPDAVIAGTIAQTFGSLCQAALALHEAPKLAPSGVQTGVPRVDVAVDDWPAPLPAKRVLDVGDEGQRANLPDLVAPAVEAQQCGENAIIDGRGLGGHTHLIDAPEPTRKVVAPLSPEPSHEHGSSPRFHSTSFLPGSSQRHAARDAPVYVRIPHVARDAAPLPRRQRASLATIIAEMPVHAVTENGKIVGYQWGTHGKVYRSKEKAQQQAKAIFASGYRGDSADLRSGRRSVAKALAANKAAELQYTKSVVGVMRGVHRGILEMVEKEFMPAPELRHDASRTVKQANAILNERLNKRVAKHLRAQVGPLYDLMAKRVTDKHSQAMAVIGIPVRDAAAGTLAQVAVARENNLRLIEDAGRSYSNDVRDVLTDPANEGLRANELRDLLLERGSVSVSRATLIAVDQTLKLSAAVNQARQTAAGVATYRWSTSMDERVRPDHADLEGQEFDWDDPPVTNQRTGDRNHPGEDFRCRCISIPIIPDLDAQDDQPSDAE